MLGSASSPTQVQTRLQPDHLSTHPKPPTCYQAYQGDEGACSEQLPCNPHRDGRNDREGSKLSPEGPGPKVFRSNLHDTCFPKRFRALNNIIKYVSKMNPSVCLGDYWLACWVVEMDDDLFIIQFLPIYIADTAMAWLNHLPRNMIDSWEDLKKIFTGNFQGTYLQSGNP
jgi:hypothetical protein